MTISLSRLTQFYGELDALPLLRVMIKEEFAGKIALLTSFGTDSALMLSLVAEIDPNAPVLFLETQKHFPETLDYAKTLTHRLGLKNVKYLTPDVSMCGRIDPDGMLWSTTPNRCCWLRKVEPLKRAIHDHGYIAIITGRKRYQTKERADMQSIELDDEGIFRINPLAYWEKERQASELAKRNLPTHPLVAKGYPSIGCAPCTLPVTDGQDERAGRWAHTAGLHLEQKTECGIHVPASQTDWTV